MCVWGGGGVGGGFVLLLCSTLKYVTITLDLTIHTINKIHTCIFIIRHLLRTKLPTSFPKKCTKLTAKGVLWKCYVHTFYQSSLWSFVNLLEKAVLNSSCIPDWKTYLASACIKAAGQVGGFDSSGSRFSRIDSSNPKPLGPSVPPPVLQKCIHEVKKRAITLIFIIITRFQPCNNLLRASYL